MAVSASVNRQIAGAIVITWITLLSVGCTPASDNANGGLVNTSWTVSTINGVAVLPAARPTLTFAQDATVGGSASCNQYSGPFRTDGDRISIGDIASTLMLCQGEIGAQEAAFLGALRAARTWRLTPAGDLELGGVGSIVAAPGIAEGPPPADPAGGLVGTRWDLVEMGGTADFARIVPTIEFRQDGAIAGFAACNSFSGSFTLDGDAVTVGPIVSTKMACAPPAMAVEAEYLQALSRVSTWSIEPDGRLLLGGVIPLRYTPR
jgi:heat shock protein HslJ